MQDGAMFMNPSTHELSTERPPLEAKFQALGREVVSRRKYVTPQLVRLGDVRGITLAASPGNFESGPSSLFKS